MDVTHPSEDVRPRTRTVVSNPLTIKIGFETEVCLVRLEGELDLESAPALSRELDRLLAGDHRRVVIDLAGLEFADSSGLQCLLAAAALSRSDGDALRIIEPVGQVSRLFEVTGVQGLLPLIPRT